MYHPAASKCMLMKLLWYFLAKQFYMVEKFLLVCCFFFKLTSCLRNMPLFRECIAVLDEVFAEFLQGNCITPFLAPELQKQSFSFPQKKTQKRKSRSFDSCVIWDDTRNRNNYVQVFPQVCWHIISTIIPQELDTPNIKSVWIRELWSSQKLIFSSILCDLLVHQLFLKEWALGPVNRLLSCLFFWLQGFMDN